MGTTSLIGWLWLHICFHFVPYWMHKCVLFDLAFFCLISQVVSIWMRFKRALLRRPLISIGTKHVPDWNVDYKAGISPASTRNRPGHASDISLQDPQPAHPGANRPNLCCTWGLFIHIFLWWVFPTKYQSYQPVKLSWGPLGYVTIITVTYEVQGGIQRVSRPLLAAFFQPMAAASSAEDRILLLQEL